MVIFYGKQEKHPSALVAFKKMMHGAESKKIVVFLDYDGTLSPIVNDPEVAFMTEKVNNLVKDKVVWYAN